MSILNLYIGCVLQPLQGNVVKPLNIHEIADKIAVYENMDDFMRLLSWFISSDLAKDIRIEFEKEYICVVINNKDIMLSFCNEHIQESCCPYHTNGKVCFENTKEFNKWSNSRAPFFFPKNKADFDLLYNLITYVSYLDSQYDDTDFDGFYHPRDRPYFQPLENLQDWSNTCHDNIPTHLQHLYKK